MNNFLPNNYETPEVTEGLSDFAFNDFLDWYLEYGYYSPDEQGAHERLSDAQRDIINHIKKSVNRRAVRYHEGKDPVPQKRYKDYKKPTKTLRI